MTPRPPLARADEAPAGQRAQLDAALGPTRLSTSPLACWLAIQLGALLLAVSGFPLAAQYPEPAERVAAYLVMGTQVVAAGLLFPFLLRDARTSVQVIACAWPFQLAAGYLSAIGPGVLVWPAALVTAWLAALAACGSLLRTRRVQALGITVATLLTLGCAALRYLRLEFAADGAQPQLGPENVSPLLSTFAGLQGSSMRDAWILLAIVLVIATTFSAARRFAGRPGLERIA